MNMNTKINYNSEDLTNHHAIAAIIKNKNGEILIQKHLKFGFWTLPIGKVLPNQSLHEGLKQEVFEECNLVITKYKQIKQKDYVYKRNENYYDVFLHLFSILEYSGELINKEPHKHSELKFMSLEDIKKLPYLSDATLLYLETENITRDKRIEKE